MCSSASRPACSGAVPTAVTGRTAHGTAAARSGGKRGSGQRPLASQQPKQQQQQRRQQWRQQWRRQRPRQRPVLQRHTHTEQTRTRIAGAQAQLALKHAPLVPQSLQRKGGRPRLGARLQLAQLLHGALDAAPQLLLVAGGAACLAPQPRLLVGGGAGAASERLQVC